MKSDKFCFSYKDNFFNKIVGELSSSRFSSLRVCNDYEVERVDEVIDNYDDISYRDCSRLSRINNFCINEIYKEQRNKDSSFRDDRFMIGFVGYDEPKLNESDSYVVNEQAYNLYEAGKISIYRLYVLSREDSRHSKERKL